MATQLEKREESLGSILRAARSLILQRGFGGISISDILSEADVTKGKFFHYFSSKEELYSQLITDALTSREFLDFRTLIKEIPAGSPTEQLLWLIDRTIAWHQDGLPEAMRLCVFATFFFGPTSPEVRAIQDRLRSNIEVITSVVSAAQSENELPRELDCETFALCIPSLATGGNLVGPLYGRADLLVANLRQLRILIQSLYNRREVTP